MEEVMQGGCLERWAVNGQPFSHPASAVACPCQAPSPFVRPTCPLLALRAGEGDGQGGRIAPPPLFPPFPCPPHFAQPFCTSKSARARQNRPALIAASAAPAGETETACAAASPPSVLPERGRARLTPLALPLHQRARSRTVGCRLLQVGLGWPARPHRRARRSQLAARRADADGVDVADPRQQRVL
eukprot:365807-Chlamydomonas_euryale.AAC.18